MHWALTPTIGRVHRGPDKPAVVANAIGHSDDRVCVSANDGPIGRSGEGSRELAHNPQPELTHEPLSLGYGFVPVSETAMCCRGTVRVLDMDAWMPVAG
jgi:hypothetical protein